MPQCHQTHPHCPRSHTLVQSATVPPECYGRLHKKLAALHLVCPIPRGVLAGTLNHLLWHTSLLGNLWHQTNGYRQHLSKSVDTLIVPLPHSDPTLSFPVTGTDLQNIGPIAIHSSYFAPDPKEKRVACEQANMPCPVSQHSSP